jgi:hypothetical protein
MIRIESEASGDVSKLRMSLRLFVGPGFRERLRTTDHTVLSSGSGLQPGHRAYLRNTNDTPDSLPTSDSELSPAYFCLPLHVRAEARTHQRKRAYRN